MLNSAALMPLGLETFLQHCAETIEQIYSNENDLEDEPLFNLDAECFTDG